MDTIADGLSILWSVAVMVIAGALILVLLGPWLLVFWLAFELFWGIPRAVGHAFTQDAHHRLQRHYK